MEEVTNIYNASEPTFINKESYKGARMNQRQSNRISEDEDMSDMSGPSMMAIDRALNRAKKNVGPKKMRE
jgi:hypothetical protein|tara:strand:+ start:500 stop:709 length:210 start_codon:yes stop_codon:yes gene_type:complete